MTAPGADAQRMSIWRKGNFVLLFSGQFLSQIGNALFGLGSVWFVLSWTHSRAALGIVGAASALGAVFGFISGTFVDRWDRRLTMVASDLVRAVLVAVVTIGVLTGWLRFWEFALAVLLLGIGGTFFSPAMGALLPDIAGDGIAAANAAVQGGSSVSQLGGVAFGGLLLATVGPVVMFAGDAVSFVVSVLTVGLLRLPSSPARPRRASPTKGMRAFLAEGREGISAMFRHPFLRRIFPVALLVNTAGMALNVLDVAWVRQVLHLGAYAYAGFGIAVLSGMVAGSVLSPAVIRRFPFGRTIVVGLLASGASVIILSLIPVLWVNLGCMVLVGISSGVITTALVTAMQRIVPGHMLGRVFGALTATLTLGNPLGALASGLVAAVVPLEAVFLGAGILVALGALLFIGAPDDVAPMETVQA